MAAPKATLSDIIEMIGLGPTHMRYLACGGGMWFVFGMEVSLISTIAAFVGRDFDVSPVANGLLVSIVYFGVVLGNLSSGPVADRCGRRLNVIASYVTIFVFSMASSYAPTYATLAILRFLVGFAFGFGQPAWNAILTEIAPNQWIALLQACTQFCMTAGLVYCYVLVYLDDPWMKHLQWRMLTRQGALPSLIFLIVAYFFLLESAWFLAASGRKSEAMEVLKTMQRDNFVADIPDDFEDVVRLDVTRNICDFGEFKAVFSGSLIVTTLIVCWSFFVVNFVYTGSLYAFPNVLPQLTRIGRGMTPAMDCMVAAMWEAPGYVMAILFAGHFARKPVLKLCLILAALSVLLFAVGVYLNASLLWHCGLYGFKFFVSAEFVMCYVLMGEVYPVEVRATGSAVVMAVGRFGCMLAPLAYEALTCMPGTFFVFFLVCAALLLTNIPLIDLLPYETYNMPLTKTDSKSDLRKVY